MVELTLADDPAIPLHERITGAVRRAVVEGEVAPGEPLPSAKDLARSLDVHSNTVLRAYRDLRDEGVIELRRGRGATVCQSTGGTARLRQLIDDLTAEGKRLGLGRADVAQLIDPNRHDRHA